jgi:acetyl esterase/lipase
VDPRDVLTRPAEPPDAVLRYGAHADALIDVFLPPSLGRPERPSPLLLLVHGGFWRQEYDRVHVRPLAGALRRSGFTVAVPEYRRVGGRGGWPETANDVEAALAALPEMLAQAAPGYVDPAAPLLMAGHSAGGHLALWAGLRAGPDRVASIAALAPVADVYYAADVRMGGGAVQELLGGEPHELPDRYAHADVLPLLATTRVDVAVLQGGADLQVPAEQNRRLASRCAGPRFRYLELPGIEHFALIDPLSPVFETALLPALRASGVDAG